MSAASGDILDPAIHRVGSAEEATPGIIQMCVGVKDKVEGIVGRRFDQFLAIRFTHENFDDGTRYFVQVDIGDGDVVHICVLRLDDPGSTAKVVAVQLSKSTDSL